MKQLLWSGLLYLVGVAALLLTKPSLMFTQEGHWKEFGIGRDERYYTWMPFWLFAIMWAILSYLIVSTVFSSSESVSINMNVSESLPVTNVESMAEVISQPKVKKANEMKPGYYVLDAEATTKKGIPKYIYLGPEAPELVYNEGVTGASV
jgi:hypothetical protein